MSAAVTVVVGFAEALSGPEVVWSLADRGWTVVAFARRSSRSSLRSSRYVSLFEIMPPEVDSMRALQDLNDHISTLQRKNPQSRVLMMPLDDAAVWLCSRIGASNSGSVVGPQGGAATLALNKWQQIQLARSAGFSVPPTTLVENARQVFSASVALPAVLKPVWAAADRGGQLAKGRAWVCSDPTELRAAVDAWAEREPMLFQQFFPGVGEGLFGLASSRGTIGWSAHRRLRMMNPQGSGSSACISAAVDTGLEAAGERFLAQCGWRGLFMIELLRDDSGKVWFMEFNGRSWGSMALARRLGLEYPAWAVQLTLDPNDTVVSPRLEPRPIVCRHLGRELLHLLYVMRGPKSKALTAWPSRWTALRQTLHFSRQDRWYNWRSDDRRVFVTDLLATLRDQLFKPSRLN